jgi:predicted nucleotidyltransferase
MIPLIENKQVELQAICEKYAVAELYLFGSALTSDFNKDSDLDFAVLFKSTLSPIEYGDAFFGLLEELQVLFSRKVDLISYRVVKNPIFKKELDRTKLTLYAAA